MNDPNVQQQAEEIVNAILTAPDSETISTIHNLLGERIRSHSRNERGEPDQLVVSMWLEDLSMRVTTHRLFVRRRNERYCRRAFMLARTVAVKAALTAIVACLLIER